VDVSGSQFDVISGFSKDVSGIWTSLLVVDPRKLTGIQIVPSLVNLEHGVVSSESFNELRSEEAGRTRV
jgi:hypothetical protein